MKTTETTCLNDELCLFKEEEEDRHREFRYRACTRPLNMLTVRVAVLEYSQLHKKAYNLVVSEFGGF